MKIIDRYDWFELWNEDKKSIISTMKHNMQSDIEAGYNPIGENISKQKEAISLYELEYFLQLEDFKFMSDIQVNRWCFYDMTQRGVI